MYRAEDRVDETSTRTKASTKVATDTSTNRTWLIVGLVLMTAIIVAGVVLASGGGDDTGTGDLGEAVVTQQQQYETLLDVRPKLERLVEIGASPAVVTQTFDELDAAQAAVAESAGGAAGYVQFLDERLAAEQAALELARTEGMASPAAVQAIQQNIADVQAEQARLAALQ